MNRTHSGISPLGTTILRVSCTRLYFMILSADVVEVREGEAFTYQNQMSINNKIMKWFEVPYSLYHNIYNVLKRIYL